MALAEFSTSSSAINNVPHQQFRPSPIDYSAIENDHQILSNSISNSSTNSNTSAFSVSSNLSGGITENNVANNHQCLKPGLIKHSLIYQHHSQSAHFHHHLHHQNNNVNDNRINRPQNILSNLHRKIEHTGSGGSSSSSACVSSSSISHRFPVKETLSNICSPSSGPQTPQSTCSNGYIHSPFVQSPLAQLFTTDSGLCLSYRSSNSSNATINLPEHKNTIKKLDFKKSAAISSPSSTAINKIAIEQPQSHKSALLNLPKKKDATDEESLLSDYSSRDLNSTSSAVTSNLSTVNSTSTTNLISVGTTNNANVNQHSTITAKPSLPGASSSFFHYPNIYNPLKNQKSHTKNNKKLIRFITVCAYVCAVSLVAILLSLYYLFIWNPYSKSNSNITRTQTFVNSEILFIEKTNYFDVDLTSNPHVIGASPDSIHLTPNVKVNLTQSKQIVLPLAAESAQEPVSIERFGPSMVINSGGNSISSLNNGNTIGGSSLTSEEQDGPTMNSSGQTVNVNSIGGGVNSDSRGGLPVAMALKKKSLSSEQDYSNENTNYHPKLINLLQTTNSNRYNGLNEANNVRLPFNKKAT